MCQVYYWCRCCRLLAQRAKSNAGKKARDTRDGKQVKWLKYIHRGRKWKQKGANTCSKQEHKIKSRKHSDQIERQVVVGNRITHENKNTMALSQLGQAYSLASDGGPAGLPWARLAIGSEPPIRYLPISCLMHHCRSRSGSRSRRSNCQSDGTRLISPPGRAKRKRSFRLCFS